MENTYENHNVDFANSHYLALDNVKGKSEPAYAGLNYKHDQTEL